MKAWGSHLFPFQARWANEPARFAACVKPRQAGFSHATAAGTILGGLLRKRPQIVLSASQDLSDEVLAKVKLHSKVLAKLGFHEAGEFSVENASELAWRSGGRVIALPASPRTARSFTGDVWLDEFAYHLDPEGIRDAAFPIAMRGDWRIRVFSTPNGAQGLFHELVTAPSSRWAIHRVSIDDAIAEGLEVNLDDLWSMCNGDERLFAQWFRGSFLDADLQYIPTALADQAFRYRGVFPGLDGATLHAGLDVGRHHDLTVLCVVAVVSGVAWIVALLTCKRSDFRAQKTMISHARKLFQWDSLHVDKSGLGEQLAEELVEKWGEDEVHPVHFTAASKADLATRAFKWLRNNRVRYPQDAEGQALYAETIAVRRKVTSSGEIAYVVPRTAAGHGDRWWATCLALKGAGEPIVLRGLAKGPLQVVA